MNFLNHFTKLQILICLCCVLLVSSCSKPGEKGMPIKIGLNEWTGYDPFILADKTDLFNKNNVRVEIKRFATATEEMQSLKDREIQGAGFTLDEVFALVGSGFKGKVVLIVDYSMGGDMLIGQKDVKSVAELEGKRVGYEGTVVGEFLLDRALHNNRVKRSSVELIDVKADKWLSSFVEKRVDALVCFNPVSTTLLNKHDGNLLFSSADMPFEIIDVLVFGKSFYTDNKAAIANILKAWFEALAYLETNKNKAAEVIAFVKNISPEDYKQGLKGLVAPDLTINKSVFDSKSDENIYKYSQGIVDFMMSKGLLGKRINTTDLFQGDILLKLGNHSESQERK
jgi:NitT/TauT family transport system substrate-binding protein